METKLRERTVDSLLMVGGSLALDFVNTVGGPADGPTEDEQLFNYGDLVAWGRRAGAISEGTARLLEFSRKGAGAFRRALEIRDLLYRTLRATATGDTVTDGDLHDLARAAGEAMSRARLVRDDVGFALEWDDPSDSATVLWPVIHDAFDVLTTVDLSRLKQCSHCRWLFLDESKNRSRRWCSMEECGTQVKMRRYMDRRAAARRSR